MDSHSRSNIVLISGTSNEKLAKKISKILKVPLAKQKLTTFKDGEIRYELETPVQGKDVYVIQSTSTPTNKNLMELLIILDALKRADAGRITAVIPYFGYSRQDRKINSQDPITAKLVASLIETAGANRVLTMDIHSDQTAGFFNIPFYNISGRKELVRNIIRDRKLNFDDLKNYMIVAPDAGSAKKTRALAHNFHLGYAMTDKERPEPNVSHVNGLIGNVKGHDVIIVDDMIDTGGTIAHVAKYLIEKGAKSVVVGTTHGVFSDSGDENSEKNGVEKEAAKSKDVEKKTETDKGVTLKTAPIGNIYSLDTIDIPKYKFDNHPKLKPTISSARLFADEIEKLHKDWK